MIELTQGSKLAWQARRKQRLDSGFNHEKEETQATTGHHKTRQAMHTFIEFDTPANEQTDKQTDNPRDKHATRKTYTGRLTGSETNRAIVSDSAGWLESKRQTHGPTKKMTKAWFCGRV